MTNIVFFGNTKYSIVGLEIVQTIYPISLIITKKLTVNPVKQLAQKLKIPVIETDKLDRETVKQIEELTPDFFIVEDFGLILSADLLEIPKYAPLNIHHSLLPRYRGPSPAPTAILNGDKVSGVTVIEMSDVVDAGDILAQKEYTLKDDETTESFLTKLNEIGGKLVVSTIKQYLEGLQKPIPQSASPTPYTLSFTRKTGYFEINTPPNPQTLDRMIRAYYPWPGVWTKWKEKIVKFLPKGLIQMEGKKPISFKDFLNGYPDFPLKSITLDKK